MRHQIIVGILIAGTAVVAIAQDSKVPREFQGKWAGSQVQCRVPHEASLTIDEDRIDFYESRGKVLSAVVTRPSEVELEIEATGEGQTWREVRRFTLSDDKRTLTDVTNSRHHFSRVRCR